MMNKGLVYLVGAGPGDPGLFTLKGKKVLEKAEVVVYDRLVGEQILDMADPQAELIYVGKEAGRHALAQEEINDLLVRQACEGKTVVRLKGGDPFLFGRGGEEALYLRRNAIDFEVIPGITSAIAVPAYAGIPVTHREATSSFAVVTGHEKPDKAESSIRWRELAGGIGTLVFLMGVENLPFICANLIKYGRDPATPVALIRWGTLPEQEVLTGRLDNIVRRVEENSFRPPAVIVVGEVVNLREELKWLENKPLWGKKIVVTRARSQASVLVEAILELGGQPIEFPSIEIRREENLGSLYNALKNITRYQWIIFTSVNAVEIFFAQLNHFNMDIRDLKDIHIAAIGPATRQEVQKRGIKIRVVPDEYRAEGILEELKPLIAPGEWILLPRARGARGILPETLRNWGTHVNEVVLYEAVPTARGEHRQLQNILAGKVDYLTFTSSSTVSNFAVMIGPENVWRVDRATRVACIGPVTAQKARDLGFSVDVMAREYTINGLVEAILEDSCPGLHR